jgi:hypothetical protein
MKKKFMEKNCIDDEQIYNKKKISQKNQSQKLLL